jgi:quinohemoprotein ethanol dehydrogenase
MAYDDELDLLYIGVGNGSPWNHRLRSNGEGDNLYLSSIVALDAGTGDYRWHFQTTPGDNWDYTATQHMILADIEIGGEPTPVIMQAPKNGFFYVIDRRDGTFLSGEAFVPMNWATGLDENGRPIEAPGARYEVAPHLQLPGPLGAHNWQPMSYSPDTGLVYIPAQEAAWAYANNAEYKPSDVEGVWNTGTDFSVSALPDNRAILKAGRAGLKGRLLAWDPVAQEARWSYEHKGAWNGGVLSTAGGLVFQGTADGAFAAFDASTGKRLWSEFVETGVVAAPITYEMDGEQYVAIATGWGGSLAMGYGGVFPTGPDHNTGRLLVFKAGGTAELPEVDVAAYEPDLPPLIEASADTLAHGRRLYTNNCSSCHGDSAISYAGMPNLRYSYAVADADDWAEIVGQGGLAAGGMPGFDGHLDTNDLEAIRAFISERAHSEQQPDWYAAIVKEVESDAAPQGGTSGSPR